MTNIGLLSLILDKLETYAGKLFKELATQKFQYHFLVRIHALVDQVAEQL